MGWLVDGLFVVLGCWGGLVLCACYGCLLVICCLVCGFVGLLDYCCLLWWGLLLIRLLVVLCVTLWCCYFVLGFVAFGVVCWLVVGLFLLLNSVGI